jgi:hypothetical protein
MVGGASSIVSIENPEAMIPSPGETFHGRDLFAPAAALLASGDAALGDLGPPVSGDEVTPMLLPLSDVAGAIVAGEAWWVDRFGNVQTNISSEDLVEVGLSHGDVVTLKVGATLHTVPWVTSYSDVAEGEALIHIDSTGLVAVAMRGGHAAEEFNLAEGMAVSLAGSKSATAE